MEVAPTARIWRPWTIWLPCVLAFVWCGLLIFTEVVAGLVRVLRLLFNDGTVGDVDFSSERWTGVLGLLNNPAYFAQATVDPEAGTVVWPGGIDLAPEPLYEQARAHPIATP